MISLLDLFFVFRQDLQDLYDFLISAFPPARHASPQGEAGGDESDETQSACGGGKRISPR